MQKVVNSTDEEMLKSVHYIKEFHFNHLPQPFKIVSKEEFENFEDTWYPEFMGIGQLHSDEQKKLLLGEDVEAGTVHIQYRFYTTRGYAKCRFRKKVVFAKTQYGEKYDYVDDVVYIRFGCSHEGRELIDSDVFARTYKCPHCGQVWSEQTGY